MNKIYQKLASLQFARINCIKKENQEWLKKHTESLEDIMEKFAPSGSGLDSGTSFGYDTSIGEKLIFYTSYHVMDVNGYYRGWIAPITIKATPSLQFGFILNITGPFGKDQDIKDIIYDRFYDFLMSEISDNFLLTNNITTTL